MRDKIGRYIVAAALCIAWSICFAAKYIVPATVMAGKNYTNTSKAFASIASEVAGPLSVASWLLLLAALAAFAWAIIGTHRGHDGDMQRQTGSCEQVDGEGRS